MERRRIDRGVGQDDREHRRHPRMDHPDTLGDARDAHRSNGQAVGVGQGDRRGRRLDEGIGRAKRLGRGRETVIGRGKRRCHGGNPRSDDVEWKPRADDPRRQEQGLTLGRRERRREHRRDLGLIGVAGGARRSVRAPARRDDPARPPVSTIAGGLGGRKVRLREADRRGREGVPGEDRRRGRRCA